jgi:hypothetical protein
MEAKATGVPMEVRREDEGISRGMELPDQKQTIGG